MAMFRKAGCSATESGAGCCGMAGSFGYESEHYDVSKKIGEDRLFPAVEAMPESATISVAGVSCRQQIGHFTGRHSRHIAEVLADRIAPGHRWAARTLEPVPDSVQPTPEMAVHAKQTGNS
jgi:Fe-S oxidoreductase